ncbi:hypothetical protein GCM10011529_18360 [Polymorphobacter glacialis]|uniref:Right handed beta helix domain-containing protein n=1 Tax=Sandarakinorhabdus glacialis TaxID=1614636 RepID=A0A916ZSS5_9SPHN|nr:NosD domain-containing protein [Polymorphobacter glacialis]GGE12336.1 hypothetical protein GCM10011529_18360 [Polymorphobacter glacialis]
MMRLLTVALVLAAMPVAAAERALVATPSTLAAVIAGARGGETITLVAGDYPLLAVKERVFSSPITIDARAARVGGLKLEGVEGLVWRGGTIKSPAVDGRGRAGYAVFIAQSKGITIRDTLITDTVRAMVIGESSDVLISKNRMIGMTIDGLNIGSGSHHVTIDGNYCETYNTGEAHPDCYQGWSRPGRPVSDIVVTNNIAKGRAQGIYFGNVPTRKPVGDPGFDRVRIENNTVETLFPNGVVAIDCRDCIIRYNKVTSLPGARFRAKVLARRGTGISCGNTVPDLPRMKASQRC